MPGPNNNFVTSESNSNNNPKLNYDIGNNTWMTGIFGCLRPVLSIIGKGTELNLNQDEWEIPFEKITNLVYLGGGGQGIVFSGVLNDQPVAVKKVFDVKATDIRNLRKLNHPNIVKFCGVCTQAPCYSIVMEFCPYGPLYELLRTQRNVVTTERIVTWVKQIANGMNYLHSQKIIHRDLKSPNVLIGEEEIIKISDFGTSRIWSGVSEKMSFAGTVAWMAPEAIQELECSEKVDIWSFGIVLWELLTCQVPYEGMEQSAIMYLVGCGKLRPPIPKSCPEGFRLIMEMCWKLNPRERPSFKLIMNHLQIASIEILGKYSEENLFFQTQKSWKTEIDSQISHFKSQLQKHCIDYQAQEEQLIRKREIEIKHIRDIKELYDQKLEKVNQLYLELVCRLRQIKDLKNLSPDKEYGIKRMIESPSHRKSRSLRKCIEKDVAILDNMQLFNQYDETAIRSRYQDISLSDIIKKNTSISSSKGNLMNESINSKVFNKTCNIMETSNSSESSFEENAKAISTRRVHRQILENFISRDDEYTMDSYKD